MIVPPAVSIAMTGTMPIEFVLLGIAALMWVSGFDVLYGIADIEFDRANGLHSIPARFGVKSSLSDRQSHAYGDAFISGCNGIHRRRRDFGGVGNPRCWHTLRIRTFAWLKENDLSKLNMAFFTMNGIIAVVFRHLHRAR